MRGGERAECGRGQKGWRVEKGGFDLLSPVRMVPSSLNNPPSNLTPSLRLTLTGRLFPWSLLLLLLLLLLNDRSWVSTLASSTNGVGFVVGLGGRPREGAKRAQNSFALGMKKSATDTRN